MSDSDEPRTPSNAVEEPIVIGVLGGIASGKSEVARLLAAEGGEVIDADRLAHAALGEAEVEERVRARFGGSVFDPSGRIDRSALAARVFSDAAARREVEALVHPRVRAAIRERIEAARARRARAIVLDVPLLAENDAEHGLARACDALVFVDCDADARAARARAQRGWSRDEVERREGAQWPLEKKRALAHHIVSNRAGLAELRAEVERVRARIRPRRPAG
jgi:dephospho-CoA kinase